MHAVRSLSGPSRINQSFDILFAGYSQLPEMAVQLGSQSSPSLVFQD